MSSESQADAIREIEQALLTLRSGSRGHHRGPRGEHPHGGGPRGFGRPPWAEGAPPWGGGHRGGPPGLAGAARFRLLEALLAATPETRIGISEVATAIGVDQPRASRLVNDAAERGLVVRAVDPRDARRSVITLTDAGRALLESARASRRSAVTEALAGFTPAETQQLAALLARFAAAWPQR